MTRRIARLAVVLLVAGLALGGCIEILALVASVTFGSASVAQRYQQREAQKAQSDVLKRTDDEIKRLREELLRARKQLEENTAPAGSM